MIRFAESIGSTERSAGTTWMRIVLRVSTETLSNMQPIVTSKGALMFVELQQALGDDKVFAALRNYYRANLFEIAQMEDLRSALIAEAPVEQRRMVGRTFTRWLTSKARRRRYRAAGSRASINIRYSVEAKCGKG
jgi:hypothetical protein